MPVNKVLIFGCNSLSLGVANELLERKIDISVVTTDEACLEVLATRGINAVSVDYTDDDELRRLGIGVDVDVIFSFFEDEAKNVFLTISARDIDAHVRIISLTQSEDSAHKLIAAGSTKVIDPYQISGRKIYDMIKHAFIAETMEKIVFGQRHLNLAEIGISATSHLNGQHLAELDISEKYDLVVLGVVDRELGDEFIFCSSGVDHKLDHGDVLVVIGPQHEIERFQSVATSE